MKRHSMRRTAALLFIMAMAAAVPVVAGDGWNQEILGVAIDGYDPVAYFTKGQALKGTEGFTHYWNDAEWRFINAEHRDRFAANPNKYAPRHGGF